MAFSVVIQWTQHCQVKLPLLALQFNEKVGGASPYCYIWIPADAVGPGGQSSVSLSSLPIPKEPHGLPKGYRPLVAISC
jgi:hypothetical protein